MMISPPQSDEYAAYYGRYIQLVPPGSDLLVLMSSQSDALRQLLQSVSEEQANACPAPGEWSVKEVIGHLSDVERIFAYRAVWIARGEKTPLPGFDQDVFSRGTDFNRRTLADLVEEFNLQRRANVLCFSVLTADEVSRLGTASDNPFSVRALLYVLAGHVIHHMDSLREVYRVEG
jgi:uncharacterized damage-inducible protein DinB